MAWDRILGVLLLLAVVVVGALFLADRLAERDTFQANLSATGENLTSDEKPCPSARHAQALTGAPLTQAESQPCQFGFRGAVERVVCPSGWACTLALVSEDVTFVAGEGNSYTADAGTFRYLPAYPPDHAFRNLCELYAFEVGIGQRGGIEGGSPFTIRDGNAGCS
jgi:hypothetical protein